MKNDTHTSSASPVWGVGNAQTKCINRVALLLTRNNERGPGPTHGLRFFESKVFSAYDPGATIKRTNGPLFNGLLRRSHPAVLPRNGSPTPVIRKLLLPEGTPRLITDVFYARFMGPRKQGIGTNPTIYFFFPRQTLDDFVQFDLRYGGVVHAGHNLGSVGDMMSNSNNMCFVVQFLSSCMSRLTRQSHKFLLWVGSWVMLRTQSVPRPSRSILGTQCYLVCSIPTCKGSSRRSRPSTFHWARMWVVE